MGKRRGQSVKEPGEGEDNLPRSAANARERTRMRVLSKSFERLKLTLPWVPADTKLSKLDTLRLAMTYINHLHSLLLETDSDTAEDTTSLSVKRSWPYTAPTNLLGNNIMTETSRFEDNNNKMDISFLDNSLARRRKASEVSEEIQNNQTVRGDSEQPFSHWLERN